MRARRLGTSGLHVSRLALGTMTWGRDTDEHEAREQCALFLEAGGTLIDTADVYTDGESERLLGRILAERGLRDEVVLATKAVGTPHEERRRNASRAHLLTALDGSLRRLGTDRIDLWQLHAWDPATPIDETLSAVDTAVASGKVRYAGISNYSGWQTAQAATWQSAVAGRAPIVTTQIEYSLLARGVEREVVPAARAFGMGLLPWSPLGRGVLTGKYRGGLPADSRGASPHFAGFVRPYLDERAERIVEAVCTAAEGLQVPAIEVALAWIRDRPGVVAPVIGARTAAQLAGALAAEQLELPMEIAQALDDVSAPTLGYPEKAYGG
jgi:aryl-alcohol dehydrogenase-like predicted oxidoreductase